MKVEAIELSCQNNAKELIRIIGYFSRVVIKAFNALCSLIPLFCDFYNFSARLGNVSLQGSEIETADVAEGLRWFMSFWCD